MSHPLSKKQLEVLRSLEGFARTRGHIPSVRELAARLRKSPTTVFQHLKALERRGYLKGDGSAHGWMLLRGAETAVVESETSVDAAGATGLAVVREPERSLHEDPLPAGWTRVPIAGSIAAGLPIEAVEDSTESRIFPSEMVPTGAFALQVKGDSMVDDHICDGDLVIVRPQDEVRDGEIAVALLDDGTATLKRVFKERTRVRLQPANDSMAPIYVDDVRIQGRVVGVWRRCD